MNKKMLSIKEKCHFTYPNFKALKLIKRYKDGLFKMTFNLEYETENGCKIIRTFNDYGDCFIKEYDLKNNLIFAKNFNNITDYSEYYNKGIISLYNDRGLLIECYYDEKEYRYRKYFYNDKDQIVKIKYNNDFSIDCKYYN